MHRLWFCDRCMPYALAVLRLVTGLMFCLTRFRSFSSLPLRRQISKQCYP